MSCEVEFRGVSLNRVAVDLIRPASVVTEDRASLRDIHMLCKREWFAFKYAKIR